MGITGLLPFIEKASRRTNVSEFSGCTVAIDSYCWLHKGAFACADRLVRGEETDVHIKYCLKYVTMLLSKNIKPILVFDGRHLPAKAMTESKRRESRDISKKRAAELLSLGKIEEARSYMRRSVDITHEMALNLIKECRKRNVDCIVAPYEADAQLAYLNIKNIAHLVITEDSDLILFGCTKVLFKMDLEGSGTLVETVKLPLIMKCPIEKYTFDKFRQMCIMSGCDYIASLPGIGLAKARQFVTATQDSNIANALKKLPSFFNRANLTVTDEYRENFLKAEATFKHQYVYDPLERKMVRLTDPDDDDVETALCVNAGELLDSKTAFQLALGNLDPFTLKKMDEWHPDLHGVQTQNQRTNGWKEKPANHPSIWSQDFSQHLCAPCPWQKKVKKLEPIIAKPRPRKVVNLVAKYVPETQDESLSIQFLSNMYCVEPSTKKPKMEAELTQTQHFNTAFTDDNGLNETEIDRQPNTPTNKSPILENKERSFKKSQTSCKYSMFKRLSKFPRTIIDDNVVESKFFTNSVSEVNISKESITIEESPEKCKNPFKMSTSSEEKVEIVKNPFKVSTSPEKELSVVINSFKVSKCIEENFKTIDKLNKNVDIIDLDYLEEKDQISNNSQKENSPCNSPMKRPQSPILEPSPKSRNPFRTLGVKLDTSLSQDSVIENTYPMETLVTPVDSQESFGQSPTKPFRSSQPFSSQTIKTNGSKKSNCRVPGLKKTASLPNNQPTLLSKFGFHKKPVLKR